MPSITRKVTGIMFTKFLHDADELLPLLMHAFIRHHYIFFQSFTAMSKGGHFKVSKRPQNFIGYHSKFAWTTAKLM